MRLWRIVTGPHPIWSGEGARRFGQRWNPPGLPAIYTGTSFAVCLVEILVHANRRTPPSAARFVEAVVPEEASREIFDPALHPNWDDANDMSVAQSFGRRWLEERRSALLIVPSVVTAGATPTWSSTRTTRTPGSFGSERKPRSPSTDGSSDPD